ncbi:MAG TPA: DUF998 domain-containing protein [Actinocrinis sp.]|jgi:hypothetical protein|uniref:DUF998 domain-containing protein n=1 Tax=Actinocrinis sp. TaxID=1920516 RepID=UPI002DDD41F2|nr:DUF998 domain-containing protein [Actinocrinis sp.]HEV3173785.1 DUF998 domain-containing protein [Actinocrinis sp.]
MTSTVTTTANTLSATSATVVTGKRTAATRALLACAALSAPLFAVVSLSQAFTRAGFDLTRNPLSQLSDGSLGWIQVTDFVLTGVLAILGAAGLRRALAGRTGGVWVPRLVRIAGIGYVAAGIFHMDPGNGFPAGTPLGEPHTMSWHSDLHMLSGTVAFAATIAACFVLGRFYAREGRRGLAIASRIAGVIFILGDGWAMVGGAAGSLTLCIGALTGMLWVSYVAARLRTE